MARVQIVGGGQMGAALVGGLLGAGDLTAQDLSIVEASSVRRAHLVERFPQVHVSDAIADADGTILAVKPDDVPSVIGLVAVAGSSRILSIAAGVTLRTLQGAAGPDEVVLRAMPNTPALVGVGASAVAAGVNADEQDVEWATGLLSAVGDVIVVTESQMDAVTGLSGSGPAYVFLIAEALADAGVSVGLPRPLAERLANQTIRGAGEVLVHSEDPAAVLKAAVTSPGGTTAAGLGVLERRGVRGAMIDAVEAATERSRTISP
ncbi:MAG: pyrroline-5-carboxylate reductase [Microthrixaceae bacterium]